LDLAFALVNDVVKKNRLEEKQDLVWEVELIASC
jgi:hypothetical protein